MQKPQCSMHWLFDYYHLAQGNLLKTTLLNEKQSNLEKEMYGNISPGAESSVHKTYFYFLKLMKKYYILSS